MRVYPSVHFHIRKRFWANGTRARARPLARLFWGKHSVRVYALCDVVAIVWYGTLLLCMTKAPQQVEIYVDPHDENVCATWIVMVSVVAAAALTACTVVIIDVGRALFTILFGCGQIRKCLICVQFIYFSRTFRRKFMANSTFYQSIP